MTKIAFNPNVNGTGTFTIAAPNSNSDRTFTLPDATGDIITSAGGTITSPLTVNINSGQNLFQTQDANNYARFTQSSGSAQVGLFRTGAPSGGMYIGGDGDQFSVWSSSFQRRLNVSQAGHVTMPNQPAFYAAVDNNTANSEVTGYQFPYVNVGNHFNTSTGRFVAPVAGTYFFSATMMSNSTGSVHLFRFRKNGSTFGAITHSSSAEGTSYRTISGSAYIPLSANDFVSIYIEISGLYSSGPNPWSAFSGHLIG